ncbi:pentapeptide repeat-containing protein [Reinekea forsetii]|nr:pentapeptide repeat-containing protein [Reinekea forsetii]
MIDLTGSTVEYFSETFVDEALSGETLSHIEFDGCTFKECDFSSAVFDHCKFIECEFVRCNLSVVQLKASRFMDVVFKESKVIGVDWTRAAWSNVQLASPVAFEHSVLNDSSFFGLYLAELSVEHCKANDVDFREGDFNEANFSGSDLSRCLFDGANLNGANFTDADHYYIDINNCKLKKAIFSRTEAVNLLESLDIVLVD